MSRPSSEAEAQRLRAEIIDDIQALRQSGRRPVTGAGQLADVSQQVGRMLSGRSGWAAATAGVLAGLALSIWNRLRQRVPR